MRPDQWQQANDLFHAALDCEAEQRAAFLAERCGGDATLLAEVQRLVAAHDRAGEFIEAPVVKDAVHLLRADEWLPLDAQQFGPYRIIREIGRGGMGAVYLAERADQQFEKRVAIKIIKRGMDTDSVLRRFRNECRILASLDCENVARLVDAGTTRDGLPYFVMEYIDGQPIDRFSDAHRLSITRRLELFREVCAAVSHAHQNRIVHRDIKPSNILVTAEGVPKLLDFGIAKVLDEGNVGVSRLTTPGLRPMTPEYASPEVLRGEPVGPASDIYSLGVVLYELLTGRLPYSAGSSSPAEIERAIAEDGPERPSRAIFRIGAIPWGDGALERGIAESRPERPSRAIFRTDAKAWGDGAVERALTPESVSSVRGTQPDKLRCRLEGDLDNIVLMALRREPERRYASVEELSEDIRRHLESRPVIARQDTLAYRTGKFVRRNRVRLVEAALVAVAIVAGLVLAPKLVHEPEATGKPASAAQTRKLAVLPFINLRPGPDTDFLGYSIAEAVASRVSYIRTLSVSPAPAVYKYRNQPTDPITAARELKANMVLAGNYLKDGEVLRVSAQLVDVARAQSIFDDSFNVSYVRLLTLHDAVARRLISALNLNLSPMELEALQRDMPRHPRAWEFYMRGVDSLESAQLPMAIGALEQSVALDPRFARAWTELGAAYVVNAALRFGGRDMYNKAQAAFDRATALNPADPRPQIMLSDMFIETNRVEEAVTILRAVLQRHPSHSMAMWQLSYAYRYAGFLEESERAGQAAYAADPGFTPRSTVFNTLLYLGQYEKFREALPPREGSAFLLFYEGFAQYHLKDFALAAASFDRAYALDPIMLQARVGKALSHQIAGRRLDGLRLLRETARQLEQRGLNDAEGVYKVAQAFAVLGDRAAALRWLRASIDGGFFCYPYLRADPLLNNVRSLPEFNICLQQARRRHEEFKRRFF